MTEHYSDVWRLLGDPPQLRRGFRETIAIPDPAAGQGWSRQCPSDCWERVVAFQFKLATSAAVANRYAVLQWQNGDKLAYAQAQMSPSTPAGVTTVISAWRYAYAAWPAGPQPLGAPIPDLIIRSGEYLALSVLSMDVADQVSQILLTVERYPSDAASGEREEDLHRQLAQLLEQAAGRS